MSSSIPVFFDCAPNSQFSSYSMDEIVDLFTPEDFELLMAGHSVPYGDGFAVMPVAAYLKNKLAAPAAPAAPAIEVVIPGRPGTIDPVFTNLIGCPVDSLSSAEKSLFDLGCGDGDLFVGLFNPSTDSMSTDLSCGGSSGEVVAVTCVGATRWVLSQMLALAAAAALGH